QARCGIVAAGWRYRGAACRSLDGIARRVRDHRSGAGSCQDRTHHVPSAGCFADVLAHALHLAGTLEGATRNPWRVDLPATNDIAIPPLLDAGFVVTALQPWFATGTIGRWDRYIFRTEDEL
ncbi:MAG TPA: hypothetical protein VGR08_04340, partial [Thermomicrobiales bacterium]|nr:hypothetical protein [Thermomicrobiales bacterium]